MASDRRSRRKSDAAPLKPLKGFDYGLANAKFDGLLFNIDRDLGRRSTAALQRHDPIREKCLSLLRVFLLFAKNSYRAMRYLAADTPPDPARDLKYVLVVPTVSRQLVDLLCTLVYMLDDLIPRAQAYE